MFALLLLVWHPCHKTDWPLQLLNGSNEPIFPTQISWPLAPGSWAFGKSSLQEGRPRRLALRWSAGVSVLGLPGYLRYPDYIPAGALMLAEPSQILSLALCCGDSKVRSMDVYVKVSEVSAGCNPSLPDSPHPIQRPGSGRTRGGGGIGCRQISRQ